MNPYETATLIESLELVKKPPQFLIDRYFPTNENTDVYKTKKILVEYKKGTRRVAPIISPRSNGVTLERFGSKLVEYEPPVTGMKTALTIDRLSERGFGEALYTNLTPQDREATMLLKDMDDLRNTIRRRLELMASELIFTNKLVLQPHDDDGKPCGPEEEIKFYEGEANPAVYTPTASWTTTKASGQQIFADVKAMVRMLAKRGIPAIEVLMAPDVADVFENNELVFEKLDNRRAELGSMKPTELTDGVAKIATFNIDGKNIDFLSYCEEYVDDEGSGKPFVPKGYIAILAPGCGHTSYGAITQLEDDKSFHTYPGKFIPRYLVDIAGNTKTAVVRSAPLPLPHQESPWVVAQVIKPAAAAGDDSNKGSESDKGTGGA